MSTLGPSYKDIDYYSGNTYSKAFTILDADSAAVDLSAASLILTIKKRKTGSVIATLTSASGIAVSGDDNNIVTLTFNVDLDERDYYYDLYNITADDTIMYGRLKVTGETHE